MAGLCCSQAPQQKALKQWCFDVGPPSTTLVQHQTNIGSTSSYCCMSKHEAKEILLKINIIFCRVSFFQQKRHEIDQNSSTQIYHYLNDTAQWKSY